VVSAALGSILAQHYHGWHRMAMRPASWLQESPLKLDDQKAFIERAA